jgi:hypothetical protein
VPGTRSSKLAGPDFRASAAEPIADARNHDSAHHLYLTHDPNCARRSHRCCNPLDARNIGSHPAERSQLAKSAIFPEKWPNSTLQADLGSQKEKKIDAGALDLSRFSEAQALLQK